MFSDNHRRNHREQDSVAKEALKRYYCLARVKPGHGDEFIGSRIIPNSLLASRDLLAKLGYPFDAGTSMLQARDLATKIASIKREAYSYFVKELCLWLELGYTLDDISRLLVRIYREQSGGDRLVKKDRKQRREELKDTLSKLRDDTTQNNGLRQLAESTLVELRRVQGYS